MAKKVIIGISAVFILVSVGIVAYILRPTPEASAPIEALPIGTEQSGDVEKEKAQDGMVDSSDEVDISDETQTMGPVVFEIVPAESEVRFSLDELLRGQPKTVVGTTDQVAGEISVDLNEPSSAKVGTIRVNARTLVTDNDFRNRAINNEILDTADYEFVTFTPTVIEGFPENPQFGEAFSFLLIGNLTIRDVTQEVTFEVNATAESETMLKGYAAATISRSDYGLEIPEVPSVANVDEEVLLEIDFVAVAK